MSLFKRLGKIFQSDGAASRAEVDPLSDLTLEKLRVGYMVDYEYQTWTVAEHVQYDYDGFRTDEWELRSGDETCFLELEDDDGQTWSISRTISLSRIKHDGQAPIGRYIVRHDEAPDVVHYNGNTYGREESGPALLLNSDGRHPLVYWTYWCDEDDTFLSIERYGEESFDAAHGHGVEPYEFDNILPGGRGA